MTRKADLQQVDLPALPNLYAKAALANGEAGRQGDHRAANRAYEEIGRIVRELRRRGPAAHRSLVCLLDDVRLDVRGWAAADALEVDPDAAVPVLERIASGPMPGNLKCGANSEF
jgi:hypothetical protein